jgi:hypothetical protein
MAASESGSAFEDLVRLGASHPAVWLKPPCHEGAIKKLQEDSKRELGNEVPSSYIDLLRISNGMQLNGAFFNNAENLVLDNLDAEREEIVILGYEGNMAWFVFDKRDGRYHTINMGYPDERFSSYDTFNEMLLAVLKEQQII